MSRYVPPHLRGKGGASPSTSSSSSSSNNNNNNRRGTPNSGRGASRWDHLDAPRDGNDRGNRNRNRGRFGFDANSNSNSNPNTNGNRSHQEKVASKGNKPTASRWANVNRSAIEAGGSSGRSPGRSPPRFGARQNHHSNRHPNNSQHVRAVFFGDSFIKLFGLLNDYSDSVLRKPRTIEVHKYKAASAKGLCRDGNENRACIRRVVDRLQQHQYPNLERLVFCFGDVDVHMSYYYKKFVVGQALTETDLEAIACDYVDFVAGLPVPEPASLRRLVVGIYPSPLGDGDVGASLKAYGSLDTLEQVEAVNASDDRKMEARQARVQLFNDALRERCAHHNRIAESQGRDPVLEYHDVQDELLTTTTISAREDGSPDDSPREVVVVRDAYRDVSDLNIHLIHETTLQLWVEKWPWYKALTLPPEERHDRRPPPIGFVEYLQKTFDEYRKTKPWAERTHVAETMGVQLPPSSS